MSTQSSPVELIPSAKPAPEVRRRRTDKARRRKTAAANATVGMIGLGVFYVAIALFMYQDYLNIGVLKSTEDRTVVSVLGSFQYADIALVLVIGFAAAFELRFRDSVLSKPSLALLGFLALFSVLGFVFGNNVGWIRTDLRIWLWGYGGFAMFRMIMKVRRPTLHLLALSLLTGTMLLVSAIASKNNMATSQSLSNARVWDLNVFSYSGMMIPLLGLVLTLITLRGFFGLIAAGLAFGLYFEGAIIIGATRSLAIALVVLTLTASVSLLFQRNRKVISSRMSPRAMWIGLITLIGAMLVIATLSGFLFSESTVLGNRFSDDEDINSGTDRLVELQDGMNQLGTAKLIVGGGIGYTFESIFDYTANSLHITVFTFLMKFGILPFIGIAIFIYFILPLRFFQAIFLPRTLSRRTRTALLVVLPSVFGWLTILTMSGGYDLYYSLGLGMAIGVFAEVKKNGLAVLCR